MTYRVELRNTGNSDLTPGSVVDPDCGAPLAGPTGDLDSDGVLQVGEVWRYTCTRTVTTPSSPDDPDVVPNTVTATLNDSAGAPLVRTADAEVRVIHPEIELTVTPPAATIAPGGTVAYTYTVENVGDIPITNPSVTAANCSPVTYVGGDTNFDDILDVTETWTFSCTTAAINADQTAQTVTATGEDLIFASTVTDTQDVTVDVIEPAIQVDKKARDGAGVPADNISVGVLNSITYEFEVTNEGDVPLSNVVLTDNTCSPLTGPVGDTGSDGVLGLTETWTYECVGGTLSTTTDNQARVTGVYDDGVLSFTVSDTDLATVTVLAPQLILTKTPSADYVTVGNDVTYTYRIANTGGTDIVSFTPADDKCAPLVRASDVVGNDDNLLEIGEIWSYTCTSTISTDTTNEFSLTDVEDSLGYTGYIPAPAVVQVFAIDPQLEVEKLATTYTDNTLGTLVDGPGSLTGAAIGDFVVYSFSVKNVPGPDATPITALNALAAPVVTDPLCESALTAVARSGSGVQHRRPQQQQPARRGRGLAVHVYLVDRDGDWWRQAEHGRCHCRPGHRRRPLERYAHCVRQRNRFGHRACLRPGTRDREARVGRSRRSVAGCRHPARSLRDTRRHRVLPLRGDEHGQHRSSGHVAHR